MGTTPPPLPAVVPGGLSLNPAADRGERHGRQAMPQATGTSGRQPQPELPTFRRVQLVCSSAPGPAAGTASLAHVCISPIRENRRAAVIGVNAMVQQGRLIVATSYRAVEVTIAVALEKLLLTAVSPRLCQHLERGLQTGD